MDKTTNNKIIDLLIETLVDLEPNAAMRSMYGGTVIELVDGDPKSRIGGFFAYAEYVSLELTKGALLDDPNGWLEGSGKMRRHIKLRTVNEVVSKTCSNFLKRAIAQSKNTRR